MAKAQTKTPTKNSNKNGGARERPEPQLPKGFKAAPKGPGNFGPKTDHFLRMTEDAEMQGTLLGRWERKDGDGYFYKITLTKDAVLDTSEGESTRCKVGQVISFDEKAGLRDLQAVLDKSPDSVVWIKCLGKRDIEGNRTTYDFDIGVQE